MGRGGERNSMGTGKKSASVGCVQETRKWAERCGWHWNCMARRGFFQQVRKVLGREGIGGVVLADCICQPRKPKLER